MMDQPQPEQPQPEQPRPDRVERPRPSAPTAYRPRKKDGTLRTPINLHQQLLIHRPPYELPNMTQPITQRHIHFLVQLKTFIKNNFPDEGPAKKMHNTLLMYPGITVRMDRLQLGPLRWVIKVICTNYNIKLK